MGVKVLHKRALQCAVIKINMAYNYIEKLFIRKDCFQVKSNLLTVDNLVFHF
jgi:hypothetical protein